MAGRGVIPPGGTPRAAADSVPDIGRSLQHARSQQGLSLTEAAHRLGVVATELEALESGTVGRMHDRIGTLRTLRAYADSLDLPGDEFVLTVLELWPSTDLPTLNGDTGVVPVVSFTSAPAGGHSSSGDYGGPFGTGVNEWSVTGVVGSINDTRQVPVFETGQVPAVHQSAPRYLKVLVGAAVVLILVACTGLALHNQISGWIHSARNEGNHLVASAKTATGITPTTTAKKSGHHGSAGKGPKVTLANDPGGQGVTIDVAAPTFSVEVVVANGPSWVQVTDSGSQAPVFSQVIPPGESKTFTVTGSATIETGSSAAHFLILEGLKVISFYVPKEAPFTLTANSVS